MEYLKRIKAMFPKQNCYILFSFEDSITTIEIRVNDYVMQREFNSFEIESAKFDVVDMEIGYMLEAIKGKLDDVKENRKLP